MTDDILAPVDRTPRRTGIPTTALTRLAALLLRHWLLCVLILAGAVLRAGATIADRPAVMVWGDSYGYLINATQLLPERFHPLVYPIFLRALWRTGSVHWMVIAQHLLAILTSVAIYATLRHLGVRRWLAAIGVAPLLLDAYQIFMEQNIVADTLMEVLIAATLILIIWSPRARLRWVTGGLAGLLIAAAILTRGVALVLIPVACLVPILSGRGWRQPAAILLTSLLLVGAYSAWNYRINGQFTFDEESGRWLYARVATIGDCHQVHGIPRDEQVVCDTSYGTDPIVQPAVEDGVGFYVWNPKSPANRLRPGPHQTVDGMLRDYTLRVIVGAPGPYVWSVVVETAQFFSPTRQEVAAGQSPLHSQSFQPETNPNQDHVLIATQDSIPGAYALQSLPGPQEAKWPIAWLYRYQAFGFIPGPVLAACLLLVLLSTVWRAQDARGRAQREAALLFGLTGLLLVVLPAATVGVELRYLLPALPFIPAAGALAVESLIKPARRAANGLLDHARQPGTAGAGRSPGAWETLDEEEVGATGR